tara:strand:+ start:2957 stop:3070 length:114 start_codon:yes stop_codon:yes gene_type:complete
MGVDHAYIYGPQQKTGTLGKAPVEISHYENRFTVGRP